MHGLTSMSRVALALALALPVSLGYGIHSVVAKLDQATRAQCAAQDWPAHQAVAHWEFCRMYLSQR